MKEVDSSYHRRWQLTTAISIITFLLGSGFSTLIGGRALKKHEDLPGHPVIKSMVQSQKEAIDQLEKTMEKVNNRTLEMNGKLDLMLELNKGK